MSRIADGGRAASSPANLPTPSSSPCPGKTLFTRPTRRASTAEIRCPSVTSSNARPSVTFRRRRVMTMAGTNPRWTSGNPNSAASSATIKSQAVASPHPPANARPRTAATMGRGWRRMARKSSPMRTASAREASIPFSAISSSSARSAPEQKSGPAPSSTSTLTPSASAAAPSALVSASTRRPFRALRFSGRFRTSRNTPSAPSSMRSTSVDASRRDLIGPRSLREGRSGG